MAKLMKKRSNEPSKKKDLLSGDWDMEYNPDGSWHKLSVKGRVGDETLGAKASGAFNFDTYDFSIDAGTDILGAVDLDFGADTEADTGHLGLGLDAKVAEAKLSMNGSPDKGLSLEAMAKMMGSKISYGREQTGPQPNTSATTITVKSGDPNYVSDVEKYTTIKAKKGHPQYGFMKGDVLEVSLESKLTAANKTLSHRVAKDVYQENGAFTKEVVKDEKSPEFGAVSNGLNEGLAHVMGAGVGFQSHRKSMKENLAKSFGTFGSYAPSKGFIETAVNSVAQDHMAALKDSAVGAVTARALEKGIYEYAKQDAVHRQKNGILGNLKSVNKTAVDDVVTEQLAAAKKEIEVAKVAHAVAQQTQMHQELSHTLNMPSYGKLQTELQRAGAPDSLLESLAKGSAATAFNKSGVSPSMGAAMMRGLEGTSVVNDVRFSALDKLAGEHARLEYERTGDVVAATQAGVDAVSGAKKADAGQAPLSDLSNQQVAQKAFQGYRDNLMKGSLTVESGNYAGPSKEHSPEDLMTFEQNQRQLAQNEAKRRAAKLQREAPKATAKAPPKTPRTVTLNVPRQDYLSGQTQQGAARAARRNIDTTGLNVDLLNIAVPKTLPGQYEVTLGGWSPVGGSRAVVQKTAPKPKSDPDLLAVDKRTDQQLAQQARINKATAQVRAREDGLLSGTSKTTRASAKEDTLDDADFAVDKTPNAQAAKVDKLGESVKVHGLELLGENVVSKAQQEQERREQNVRQRREKSSQTSNDNASHVGAGSQAGRDAASQISMGETSGRSTGYNDRQSLATALSRSGQHGDVGVSDLTSHGTIRGSQQSKMLAEQDKGLFGDSDSSGDNSRVICTELVRQGLMAPSLQRLDIAYTLRHLSPATVRGYHAWAVPYVRLMKRSHLATRLVEPLARWRAEEIAFRMKSRSRPHYRGRVVRWLGEPVCWALGTVLGWVGDPDRFYPQPKPGQNKT